MSAVLQPRLDFAPMTAIDLDAVAAAEIPLYEFPWTRTNFSDSLAAGYSAWVMRLGQDLVGYAVMMVVIDEAHILNLSIAREWQRQGNGMRLLDFLIRTARLAGVQTLFLEVRPSNSAARALYGRRGFRQIGVRRGYYPATWGREDALVMTVRL